jgi:hypothetical protein
MANYMEVYQEAILAFVCMNRELIEKVLKERILSFGKDTYTEGVYVKTTVDTYWFGWDWNVGGDVAFNNWGNGVEGIIYEDGTFKLERYDA